MKQASPNSRRGPMRVAAYLIIAGEILILLALCDFAARLDTAVLQESAGAILRMSSIGGTLSASGVLLAAGAIGLDYMERETAP